MLEILLALIDRFEGCRLRVYRCPAGVWTIGKGHTRGVTKDSPPITPRLADEFEREDANEAVHWALKLSPELVNYPRVLAAVADFIFNFGQGRYAASTLRRKIRDGEWLDAREEFLKWVWAGGRKQPGLVLRRRAEAALVTPS